MLESTSAAVDAAKEMLSGKYQVLAQSTCHQTCVRLATTGEEFALKVWVYCRSLSHIAGVWKGGQCLAFPTFDEDGLGVLDYLDEESIGRLYLLVFGEPAEKVRERFLANLNYNLASGSTGILPGHLDSDIPLTVATNEH